MAHCTIAPSSSSAACSASRPFDVFINHCGSDVKNAFARHLYRSLNSRGLRVFLDQPELQAGQKIYPQIQASIQAASVHIAIFSENYAKSKWCLDELCLMVESEKTGATILPVFYNVKPEHLRWTGTDKDGPYAKALRKHEEKQRYDSQRIQSWREALSHVADLSGFVLEACNGDEAELLEKVVQRVLTKVTEPALHVAKYATGLGEKIEEFEKTVLFQEEEQLLEAKVVGIAGAGGVGKTTLAKEFFNCKRSSYNRCSFLLDVRDKAHRSSLHSLQSQLIKDLTDIDMEIKMWEKGIGILQKNLKSCHALIILDDIDDADQLDAFLPIKGVLDPKSLILVTSRDKHVLKSVGIAKSSIFHLKGLNNPHSQQLFCSHAFFQPHPRLGFENLVVKFVKGCDGLPLSLKVFGALLCEKDESYWEEKLLELHKLPSKIMARLKISYDSLSQKEKQVFLDIACFAIGEERDKWIRIWGGLVEFQTLEDRCLVDVDSGRMIRMHDHLRDLGRDIAEEESMPRRLWRSIEDVNDLFEEQSSSVIPEVRGIVMSYPWIVTEDSRKVEISLNESSSHEAFKIRKLQLLDSKGDFVQRILSRVRSPNLIWLRWNECPCSSLPPWVPIDHLRVLEVTSFKLNRLWQSESQAPLQLRELYVNAPLLEFPKSLGKLKYLEKIDFVEVDLPTFPKEFGDLCSLKYLRLNRFDKLQILPNYFGNLTNLQYIYMYNCESLKKLPNSLGNLTNLQHIDMYGSRQLQSLPNSLGNLTNLYHIKLSRCKSLKKLPNSLGNLKNLQQIDLDECRKLQILPNSLGNLTNLHRINLSGCKSLKMLPSSLGNLTNLQHIDLDDCNNLKMLPDSFGNLTNLKHIDLYRCSSLKMLPDSFGNLTILPRIHLVRCRSLEMLPDSFGNLTNLQHIDLSWCSNLQMLPDTFGNLRDLQSITMAGCKRLEMLPDTFGNLRDLQSITMAGCKRLEMLPDFFGNLTNLREIDLSDCSRLEMLPDFFANLTNLREINLCGCSNLKMLSDSFGNLRNLQRIHMSGCKSLEILPDSFWNLTNLQLINLSNCSSLEMLPVYLGNLINLQRINLSACSSLKMLPDSLGNLTSLRHINLSACSSLEMLPDSLGNLTNVQCISLGGSSNLKMLPNSFGNLLQLKHLHLSDCCSLTSETLVNITTLECLDLSGHSQMRLLPPEVGRQQNLKRLHLLDTNLKYLSSTTTECLSNLEVLIIGSPLLKELPRSLGSLTSLKELRLHGCPELKCLPNSVGLLTQMTLLDISDCGIQYLPAAVMKINSLQTLRVRSCPLQELPFKKGEREREKLLTESAPGRRRRKRKRRASREMVPSIDKGLFQLKELELYCTEISEVSFPEGTCPNLEYLMIRCCDNLKEVGALPVTLRVLGFRGCVSLMKIKGLSDLVNHRYFRCLEIIDCPRIEVDKLPGIEALKHSLVPPYYYNRQMEREREEDEMIELQEGNLWTPNSAGFFYRPGPYPRHPYDLFIWFCISSLF